MTKNIAKVIVDVSSAQTEDPYDYLIRDDLLPYVQKGMRVQVPFGVRHILGYVVEITDQSNFDGELKEITSLLDEKPVLNQEMLDLGASMAKHLLAFQVECYQTILPTMLKTDYEKYFIGNDQLPYLKRQKFFPKENERSWKEVEKSGELPSFLEMKEKGEVTIDYRLKDRKKIYTQKFVQPLIDREQIEKAYQQLRKAAKKQEILLNVLEMLEGQRLSVEQFKKDYNLSLQTLRAAEKKGWLKIFEEPIYKDPYRDKTYVPQEKKTLTLEQQKAYDEVLSAIQEQKQEVFLLQGVTGSGKTELYLQWIEQVLLDNKTAILLVPEISLTPQMVKQLKSRFKEDVAVLHSQLSSSEQFDEWRRMKEGKAKVVVGARSSIFAPLENLGLIILDEEHEASYKQEDSPRYHARDLAKWRGKYWNCPVVLGSATPSLESRARAQNKVYHLLTLDKRANGLPLPLSQVIDMREEYKRKNFHSFSRPLVEAMNQAFQKGQQVALLLNRRGYANYLMCRNCGSVMMCPNCSVSLTYHYKEHEMKCHYCGYHTPRPERCPVCQKASLREFGSGTEKVEEELHELFPSQSVVRMDNDTTRKKGAYERILKQIETKKASILLGTQMIAKGLNFPNITVVGILNADTSLYLPDFRSSERTFQLLTQVSGRAGRGDELGKVFIQTFNPDHYAIQLASQQDYKKFYRKEMSYRKLTLYPPYFYATRFTVSHTEENQALKGATALTKELKDRFKDQTYRLIGPSQTAIARIKKRYYYQILLEYRDPNLMEELLASLKETAQEWSKSKLYLTIDVEPMKFL